MLATGGAVAQQVPSPAAPSLQGQPPQGQPSGPRLPGVRIWNLQAVTPEQADRQLRSRPANPALISPKGFAGSEMHLVAPSSKQE